MHETPLLPGLATASIRGGREPGEKLSDAELQTIDLVLLDIKSWDPERHRTLTRGEVGPTLDFARRLATLKRPVWLRFVLVPGVTDHPGDMSQIAAFAAGLGNVARVDVLPFHQMGRYKWKQLHKDYTLPDVEPPTDVQVANACAVSERRD